MPKRGSACVCVCEEESKCAKDMKENVDFSILCVMVPKFGVLTVWCVRLCNVSYIFLREDNLYFMILSQLVDNTMLADSDTYFTTFGSVTFINTFPLSSHFTVTQVTHAHTSIQMLTAIFSLAQLRWAR